MSVPESLYAEPHALQSWEYVREKSKPISYQSRGYGHYII